MKASEQLLGLYQLLSNGDVKDVNGCAHDEPMKFLCLTLYGTEVCVTYILMDT